MPISIAKIFEKMDGYEVHAISEPPPNRSMGLKVVGFVAASVLYRYQYCLFEPEYREKSFAYFSNGIKAAAELGSKSLHINSGWGYKTEHREEAWKRSSDMLFRLANVAQQEGIVLSMNPFALMKQALLRHYRMQKECLMRSIIPFLKSC
ncbi:TIM barrel protein [Neobacillus vireti]|uniref:TIM barrel protein n=1 Tax=Neobacillus vireti TaxID=220686 RepID=UPI003000B89B